MPRKSIVLMAPVGLPAAAGMLPQVAQVPIAMTAAAPGAICASRSAVGMGLPASPLSPPMADMPMAEK